MQQHLGHYRIERELGRGGMGTVYQAVDEAPDAAGRVVALKVLPPELAREPQFFHRFRREIRTLAKLDHPGIVRILDVGSEGTFHYYAMEYVDGPTLQNILERERRLDPMRACKLGLELCDALEHAHRQGIIHRDLKPANILLDAHGRTHLTDFGIAKVIEATRMTTTGGIVGTAEYMSPEQAEGRAVDRRSDLYGLGVVLYRALTGRVPFEGKTVLDVIRQHRYAVLESPKELNPEMPSALSALIEQLLEKEPEKRPPSAALAKRALQSAHRMLEAGGGELAEVLFRRTEERRAEEEAAEARGPYARAAVTLAVCLAIVALAVWWTRPPSAAALLRRSRRMLQRDYYREAIAYSLELKERYPAAPEIAEAEVIEEEARQKHYEHGKDMAALVEGITRSLARGVVSAADVRVPDPDVTAGDIGYARALRDRVLGRLEAAGAKFEAVAVIFERDEPLIAASARRQAEEIAALLAAGRGPETRPTTRAATTRPGLATQPTSRRNPVPNTEMRLGR